MGNRDDDLVERDASRALEPASGAPTGRLELPERRSEERPGVPERSVPDLASRAGAAAQPRFDEPIQAALERVTTQIDGLQNQLEALVARRNEAVAERASQRVGAIVAAAERSAAEIRAAAEQEAAAMRERLLAEVQANVERIHMEAQSDAARIRMEAHAKAAQARQTAIENVVDEVDAVCARLSDELQARARAAIAGIAGSARLTPRQSAESHATATSLPRAAAHAPKPTKRITDDMQEAVHELHDATTALEQSLLGVRAARD